jgi:hypothetical protein
VDFAIPLIAELQLAKRFADTIVAKAVEDLQIKSWEEYGR